MNLGGIESFLMSVLRNSDHEENSYVFLVYSNERFDFQDEIERLGARIKRISNPKNVSVWRHIVELKKAIQEEHPDVVHAHTYFDSAYVLLAAFLVGVRIRVAHSHTTLASTENRLAKKIKWLIARILIYTCATHRIGCSSEAGIALFGKQDFKIIPNGIALDKFYFNESVRNEKRTELSIADGVTLIGHVGRLDTPKNHLFLIDIFAKYHQLNTQSKLVLVGSGKLQLQIERRIAKYKIEDAVILLGDRRDVDKLLNAFDIFIFPSIYEGLPVSLVEVQANGLPAFVSNAISNEVALTRNIQFYSLSWTAAEWAKKIFHEIPGRKSTNGEEKLQEYSINHTITQFHEIYSGVER
jgi:glycosyltransferase involved in cell wall biosynthesis